MKPSRIIKNTKSDNTQPITLKLEMRSADRSEKDVGKFRRAQVSAERIHHPNRTELYDIYDDAMLDLHLSGIIDKRIDAILNKSMYFRKSDNRDETFDELVESDVFREITRQIMLKKIWGLSGMQFIIGKQVAFDEVPRKHIKPDLGLITYEQSGSDGFDYLNDPFIWVLGGRNDYGLLLKCAAYVIWKRGNWADWAQFIEIFGMPVRIMTYNMHDPQSKIEAKKALQESGSALELLVPEGVTYDMKDGKQGNANGELQDKFRRAINDELSVCILGNTETTTSSKSSGYAQSKEHAKQQFEVTKSDMVYLLNQLNSPKFLSILKSYGYAVEGGKFEFERELDMQAVKEQMVIISMAKKLGTPVDDDFIYDVTGIPKPKNYDELKQQQEEERQARQQQQPGNDPENTLPRSPGEQTLIKRLFNGFSS